jgi:expansin (peptidoglycan-binding protein)
MAVGHHHRRRRSPLGGRRFLLGFGVTGAGLAAIAIAVAVGVGQVGAGQASTTARHNASALSLSALSRPALSVRAAAVSAPSGTVSGIATHYVLDGLPNCSYPSPPPDQLFVALSPSEYDAAGGCGGYLEVTGPDGSVRVKVIDQCPECATGHIDLSEPAFAKLAPLQAGLINVSYTYLTDPALPGPLTMEVKTGSSAYWLALLADNTGNPLASMQVESSSGSWISLARASYNYWIAPSGAGPGPFTVRLTDIAGNQATVDNIALSPGSVQSTGTYLYGAGSVPAPSSPTPSAPASTSAAPSPTAPAAAVPSSATPSTAPSSTAAMTTRPSPAKHSSSPSASHARQDRSSPLPRATDPQLAVTAPPSAAPAC